MSRTQAGFSVLGHQVLLTDLVGNACAVFVMVLVGFRGWLRQYRAQTAEAQDLEAVAP
ncbi:hypothetical protein [Actinomadura alba]|uniref:Uncharacterized protein n=1 Tax=Actinomadura alba TaxID=406431 RepID=A0ABR7LKX2_9ACTN|nr:hypothetical protein [Actinomadura alba]MBC6465458.1 hypothetical protein [Actinomadura alba]